MHEGLLFDEARAIIASHEREELDTWLVWRDDWTEWKRASRVPGLDEQTYRPMPTSPPPLPDSTSIDGGPAGFLVAEDASLSVVPTPETDAENSFIGSTDSFVVRAKTRFKKRYSIIIEVNGKIFRSHTRDISVGGVNVEDLIPDWVTGYFKMRVSKPNTKQQLELQCCLVEGQAPHARYRLMILPLKNQEDENNLENWLAA